MPHPRSTRRTSAPGTLRVVGVLATWLLLCGCQGNGKWLGSSKKFSNPVVGPPPVRVANLDSPDAREPDLRIGSTDDTEGSNEDEVPVRGGRANSIRLASSQATKEAIPVVASGDVAALVNGRPVFYDEVLEPFAANLSQAKKELPPAKFQELRRQIVHQHVRPYIERELLMQGLRQKLKTEQLDSLGKFLDNQFEDEAKKMMREYGATTLGELNEILIVKGSNLENFRNHFRNQGMAQQFLTLKANLKEKPDRSELLAYYQEHAGEYDVTAQVKWQQIVIGTQKRSKSEAEQLANDIMKQLEAGEDFSRLARKYSDGPSAKSGGDWDWTSQNSLASTEIDELLFTLPLRTVGGPVKTPAGFEIVRPIERTEAGRKPFADVQDEIRKKVRGKHHKKAVDAVLDELWNEAQIQILVDE